MDHGIHRKRKADDVDEISAPWIAPTNASPVWSHKRPRLIDNRLCFRASRPPPIPRLGNDIEDIGVVNPHVHPGPSSGSLLRPSNATPRQMELLSTTAVQSIPIDPNSIHIPSLQPLINRHTLKELHLDSILRNPQLRHDILFDSGLQFRPTSGRRKREASERYWAAVVRELETGCTCVSFDLNGAPRGMVCACSQTCLPSSQHPVVAYSSTQRVVTLRMPSRIPSLLQEFLQVLLLVIQPLSTISGMYVNPDTFKAQMHEHSAQATYVRSIFDPILIEQELKHNVFDPSGLFRLIGSILKGHCAPMRDQAVEDMVQVAELCGPEGPGTKADAVKAFRMCMDILECMKLDIANHQLQSLRPFLIRTSGQFELKAFRTGKHCSLRLTREWLNQRHTLLLSESRPIPSPSGHLDFHKLCLNKQVFLSVVRGLTDLVFSTSTEIPFSSQCPETLYLDHGRILTLGTESTELTALYLYLLLYRQLLHSQPSDHRPKPSSDDGHLTKLKNEIRDIASSRLSQSFMCRCSPESTTCNCRQHRSEKSWLGHSSEKWGCIKRNVTLQIAMRASTHAGSANTANPLPDEQLLNLALRWADINIDLRSNLCTLVRTRLKNTIFNAVVALVYPSTSSASGSGGSLDAFERSTSSWSSKLRNDIFSSCTSGLEPLFNETRLLSEKVAKLTLIHLNAYLPLYEQEHFLDV